MSFSVSCPHCLRPFTFDPADAPAQTASSRHRRGPVVAYYPDCPHCRRRAEVPNPEFQNPRPDDVPGAAGAGGTAAGPPPGRAPAGDRGTVLVVEDDRELGEGLREVLQRQGYRVILAGNGAQGRDTVYRERPDLVVLDMMMPRMGGFPVLEHFRGKADAPPFVMITANEGSRHKAYAEMLGVVGYLRKPFAMETLIEVVARGLAGRSGSAPGGGGTPQPG